MGKIMSERKITVAATQMACSPNTDTNLAKAESLVRKAKDTWTQLLYPWLGTTIIVVMMYHPRRPIDPPFLYLSRFDEIYSAHSGPLAPSSRRHKSVTHLCALADSTLVEVVDNEV